MSACKKFFRKYFLEGQALQDDHQTKLDNLPKDASCMQVLLIKYRKQVGILIPFTFFQFCWWAMAIKWNYFQYFPEKYVLSLTMIFGATVAGMTSEGGGAVAFPVMTLALGIAPSVARDYSVMSQSFGMSAAAFTIFWMKIKLEKHSLLFCSLGGIFGLIVGLEFIDTLLTPPVKKLGFVSVWFSFAFALFLLNREHKRTTFDSIPSFGIWHAIALLLTGFCGGMFTAIAGSGVDICSFSILSLLFRVSEKVSTPTSVVLMAINTCVGFYWKALMSSTIIETETWEYLAVCVPIVVLFAPLGSMLASHFHRQVLAALIYILDTVALVAALFILPLNLYLILMCVIILVIGFIFFFIISKVGARLLTIEENKLKPNQENQANNATSNV